MADSYSLTLNSTEYLSSAKFIISKVVIEKVTNIMQLPSPSKIRLLNRQMPVTTVTIQGIFTDFAEVDNLLDDLDTANVRTASNNTLTINKDSRSYTKNVLCGRCSIDMDTNIAEGRIAATLVLLVDDT